MRPAVERGWRRLPHAAWLLTIWIALWGNLSVANVVSGVIVVTLLLALFSDAAPRPVSSWRPLAAVRFVGFFVRSLVVSTIEVARAVLGGHDVRPAIISFTMRDVSDAVVTLVADSITLTPGTMTLDIRTDGEDAVLYIHVFDLKDEEAVRADLTELRQLALEAFGGRDALEHLEETVA